jgi:hypothetical protein
MENGVCGCKFHCLKGKELIAFEWLCNKSYPVTELLDISVQILILFLTKK